MVNRAGRIVLVAVIVVFSVLSLFKPVSAAAYDVSGETVIEEQVSSGVLLRQIVQKTAEGPLKIIVLAVDLRDPYVRLKTLVGGSDGSFSETLTVREMAERSGAVAALNADFFHLTEGKHPLGMTVAEQKILSSPMQRGDYYSFALGRGGVPVIDLFNFTGEVVAPNGVSYFSLSGINKPAYSAVVDGKSVNSDVYSLHMYTPVWGPESRGVNDATGDIVELVVAGGKVQEVRYAKPPVTIPCDGYVLRGHGTAAAFLQDNFSVGDAVTVRYRVEPLNNEIQSAVGGQALLVENGRRVQTFSQNIRGKNARSAIGTSRDGGTLYLVAVEQSGNSRGVTQEELADFLVTRLGVWRALNLDGGGSTSLAVRPLGDFKPVLMNVPAKGSERKVPDALGVLSVAPPGTPSGLVVRGPLEVITGLPYRYRAGVYDNHFNPCAVDAAEVLWKVEEGAGTFNGDTLTAAAGGSIVVGAGAKGVTGRLVVRALGPEDMDALEAAPGHITLVPGGQVKLDVRLRGKDGRVWPLPAQFISWEGHENVGEIRAGVFYAAQELAAGMVTAAFQGLKASVRVEVAPPGRRFLWLEPEGISMQEGKFDVKIAPGVLSHSTPVTVETYLTPSDLPAGYIFLEGMAIRPVNSQASGAYCLVRWSMEGQDSSRVVFFLRDADGRWIAQPTTGSGADPVVARVYGLGEFAAAVREGKIQEPGDIAGHWSRQAVNMLMTRDVVHGFPDGTFRPDAAVTRAQFAAILANALGWGEAEGIVLPFRDRIPEWAAPGIRAAVARGVIAGYPDGRFLPDRMITRAEMAALMDRALKLEEGECPVFNDSKAIPRWAEPAVRRAGAAGLMKGADGFFRPLATATRGETAALILKSLGYYTRW